MTGRSGPSEADGFTPDDPDMWVAKESPHTSAQEFILSAMGPEKRALWKSIADGLTEDEAGALVHAWQSVTILVGYLASLGGPHADPWPVVEERARAAIACLLLRRLIVVVRDDGLGVSYARTEGGKMVAALASAAREDARRREVFGGR